MVNVNGVVNVMNVKCVEVMMVKKEVVNGKEVKRIKMVEMDENVDDYVKFCSSDKVKDEVKNKIRLSRVFDECDVNDLWYKWDEFLNCWKKRTGHI